ncbi:MAG: hypothetical protein EXR70_00155 [Deltaproteobacteria bacterium]|nr:hypothetical protein [Deltaproteobacteria bacterium]
MKLRSLIAVFVSLVFTTASFAAAQQPAKIPRIGYVSGTGDAINQGPYVEALRRGLRELGHVEGKNFIIEYRGAEGKLDRVPSLVTELLQLKVDILVASIPQAIFAAKKATQAIPIVMVTGLDPVATGLVDSLAHPGGNITGLATLSLELSEKRLALLKEVVPRVSRVGVLRNPTEQAGIIAFKEYETAARIHKV